jgi:hypothetical protein
LVRKICGPKASRNDECQRFLRRYFPSRTFEITGRSATGKKARGHFQSANPSALDKHNWRRCGIASSPDATPHRSTCGDMWGVHGRCPFFSEPRNRDRDGLKSIRECRSTCCSISIR